MLDYAICHTKLDKEQYMLYKLFYLLKQPRQTAIHVYK